MAGETTIYKLKDNETGEIVEIRGPIDATDDELNDFMLSSMNEAPQPQTQGVVPQAEQPQVAAPSGVQVDQGVGGQAPAMQAQETETVGVRSAVADAPSAEWMDPEFKATVDSMYADPSVSRKDITDSINAHAREKGLMEFGDAAIAGTEEDLAKYRQALAEGQAPSEVGYTRPSLGELGLNDQQEVAAPEAGELGFFEQLGNAVSQSAQEGFGGVLARKIYDFMDTGKDEIRKLYPEITDDQLEDLTDYVVATSQKDLIAANEIKNRNSDWLPWLSGQLLGSGSPVDAIIPGGGKFVSQMVKGGISGAVDDVLVQGANVYDRVQDEYQPMQTAFSTAIGTGLGGATATVGNIATNRRVAGEVAKERAMAKGPLGDNAPIAVPTSRKGSKAYKAELTQAGDAVAAHVGELKKDWTNVPEIEVLDNFAGTGADPKAIGAYREDGSIILNTQMILEEAARRNTTPEAIASAVTFHESLGHYGLQQKFGADLDIMMERFYDNGNLDFKMRVDERRAKYPGEDMALSVEETLAKMSEKGRIPVKYIDELKNTMKDFGRKMGLDLKYSTREIEAVLGMAHAATMNGKKADVAGNGFGFKYDMQSDLTRAARKAENPRGAKQQQELSRKQDQIRKEFWNRKNAEENIVSPYEEWEKSNNKYMMTGEEGASTANGEAPDSYYEAVMRGARGEDAGPSSMLRKETGWFKGPDNMWRMEIDDSNANYNLDFTGAPKEGFTLNEVIDHPALFDMYPDLQNVRVIREAVPGDTNKRYQGWFDKPTNTLNITPYADNPKGTLLHEIQHWVQEKEGFSRGGTDKTALQNVPDKKLVEISKKVAKYHTKEARKHRVEGEAYLLASEDPLFNAYGKAYQNWSKESNKAVTSKEAIAAQRAMYETQDAAAMEYLGTTKTSEATEADRTQFYTLLMGSQHEKGARYGLQRKADKALELARGEMAKAKKLETVAGTPDRLRLVLGSNEHLPFQAYQHMFGEVEARDTSNRRTLNQRERELSEPYSSETRRGIEPDDYVFTNEASRSASVDASNDNTNSSPAKKAADYRELAKSSRAQELKNRKKGNTERADSWAAQAAGEEELAATYAEAALSRPKYMLPDSAVVNEDGTPKAVYHGTSKDSGFKNFKVGPRGAWFTEDPDIASTYAIENDSKSIVPDPSGPTPWSLKEKNTAARVAPVYLDIRNPKVLSSQDLGAEVMARGGESYSRGEAAYFRELRADGFDGVKVESHAGGPTTWVVLDKPSQIISATNPKGGGKYMMADRYDPIDVADLTSDELFESNNALDILKSLTENQERILLTDQEIRAEAEMRGWTGSNFLKTQQKEAGDISRRLVMYDIAADKMNTKITNLYAKLQNGTADAGTAAEYAKTLVRFEELVGRIIGEQSEVGRALRTLQNLDYTRNKLEGLKGTLAGLDEKGLAEYLADPDSFLKFAREIQDQLDEAKARTEQSKVSKFAINALNLPRAIMSSMDLSAPLRQGIFFIGRKEFWKAVPSMFKYAMSDDLYKNLMLEITQRPNYDLMVKNNLAFSNTTGKLSRREEDFMTEWADVIPGVKQSNRAYAGFLNKLRADVFDTLVDKFEKTGMDMDDGKMMKDMAGFINNATGRGDLGKFLSGAAPALNTVFFSPRLIASRVRMLNPVYYARLSPPVRAEAMKSLMSFGAIAMTVMTLLEMGGATVEGDPRSTDFGKVKFGDTRYDVLGGFAQYITLGARLETKSKLSSMGDEQRINDPSEYRGETRGDVAGKFLTNKFAPVTSYLWAWFTGSNAIGEPFDVQDEAFNRMLPMFLSDYNDMTGKYGVAQGTAKSIPGVFGVGFQDYKPYALDSEKELEAPDTFDNAELEEGDYGDMTVKDGKVTVAPEVQQEWGERLNSYIQGWMAEEMADPAWEGYSDKEKAKIIADVRKESKERAREDIKEKLGI